MAFTKADKQLIEGLIQPIAEQCATQTQAVSDINNNLNTIKVDNAIANTRLDSIDKHLARQNGRLDKTEDEVEIVKTACARHQNNWGWTRKIVLWAVSTGGLIGLAIAVISLL